MADMILYVFRQLFTEVPCILVCIGCIVAAFVLWQRAPSASFYVVLACGLTVVLLILYPLIWWYMRAFDIGTSTGARTAWSYVWSMADSIKIILLVVAVYIGRRKT